MYFVWEDDKLLAVADSKKQLQRLVRADFEQEKVCQDERCDCDGFCTGMCKHRHPCPGQQLTFAF